MELIQIKDIFTVDKWLQIYLLLMIIDCLTGLLKAYKVEGFKSRKLRDGLIRSISELVAIVFSGILDFTFGLNILMINQRKSLFHKNKTRKEDEVIISLSTSGQERSELGQG